MEIADNVSMMSEIRDDVSMKSEFSRRHSVARYSEIDVMMKEESAGDHDTETQTQKESKVRLVCGKLASMLLWLCQILDLIITKIVSMLSAINYSEIPSLLAEYSRCLYEVAKNGVCVLIMVPFVYTVYKDIHDTYRERLEEARTEVEQCTLEYTRNYCWPMEERRPALEKFCAE